MQFVPATPLPAHSPNPPTVLGDCRLCDGKGHFVYVFPLAQQQAVRPEPAEKRNADAEEAGERHETEHERVKEEEVDDSSDQQQPPSNKRRASLRSANRRQTRSAKRYTAAARDESEDENEGPVEEETADKGESTAARGSHRHAAHSPSTCAFCHRQLIPGRRYKLPTPAELRQMDYGGPLPDPHGLMCGLCYNHVYVGKLPPALRNEQYSQPTSSARPAAAEAEAEEEEEEEEQEEEKKDEVADGMIGSSDKQPCAVCDKAWDGSKRYNTVTAAVLKRLGYDGWCGEKPHPQRTKMCRSCYRYTHVNELPKKLRRSTTARREGSGRTEEEERKADDERKRPQSDSQHSGHDSESHNSDHFDAQHNFISHVDSNDQLVPVPLPCPNSEQQGSGLPVPARLLGFDAVQQAAQHICAKRRGCRLEQLKRSLAVAAELLSSTAGSHSTSAVLASSVTDTFSSLKQCWQHLLPQDEKVKRWNELLHLWLALVWLHQLDTKRGIRTVADQRTSRKSAAVLTAVRLGVLEEAYHAVSWYQRQLNRRLAVTAGLLRCQTMRLRYLRINPLFCIVDMAGSAVFEPSGRDGGSSVEVADRMMEWMCTLYTTGVLGGEQMVSMDVEVKEWLDAREGAAEREEEERAVKDEAVEMSSPSSLSLSSSTSSFSTSRIVIDLTDQFSFV